MSFRKFVIHMFNTIRYRPWSKATSVYLTGAITAAGTHAYQRGKQGRNAYYHYTIGWVDYHCTSGRFINSWQAGCHAIAIQRRVIAYVAMFWMLAPVTVLLRSPIFDIR